MRRGSLVAPVLLVAVGVLLLVNNLRPQLSLWDLVTEYWPFLLIVWGGLRLVEILAAAARSQPLPRVGITGGEWVLVVLVSLAGSGTHFAKTRLPHARITMQGLEMFGEAFDFPVSGQADAGEAPQVVIENLYGNVRVAGADTTEVRVEGRTTVRAFERNQAESAHERCPLEVTRTGDQVIVRTNQGRVSGNTRIAADLALTVPKGAVVIARGRDGDFDVTNVAGSVEIDSDEAGVRLAEIGGDARVSLRRSDLIRMINVRGKVDLRGRGGDIELDTIGREVTIDGSYSGELTMRNLSEPLLFKSKRTELRVARLPGQIRMDLGDLAAENFAGPLILKTGTRDVRLAAFTGSVRLEIDRGDVELWPGAGAAHDVEVTVRSGDLMLALPEPPAAAVEAVTSHGDAVNEYGPRLTVEPQGEHGARIAGPQGRSVGYKMKTGRGTITVRRGSVTLEEDEPSRPGEEKPQKLETSSV